LWQSPSVLHFCVSAHSLAAPHPAPQSTSVSVPFCTPSVQVGALQVFAIASQIRLSQSLADRHFLPSAHGPQPAPPQSMSVSSPSWIVSAHGARTHLLL